MDVSNITFKQWLIECSGAVLAKDSLVDDCYNKFKGICCDDKFPLGKKQKPNELLL